MNLQVKPFRSTSRAFLPKFNKWQWEAQSMVIPGIIFLIIFVYIPIVGPNGLIIAFKDYNIINVGDAPWVGLKFFKEFLSYEKFYEVLRNTLAINVLQLVFAFPAPIVFALLLNEVKSATFKRITQTVSYLPHFVSWAIFGGLALTMLDMHGAINDLLRMVHITQDPVFFMGKPSLFWIVAVLIGMAKNFGWGSILYFAAISGVDPQLYDSAVVDGANRFQKMWYITIPSISGTIVILLILEISRLLNTGFDQIWMLQNPLNVSTSETLETYVYKQGLVNLQFSYAAAVGLMKSVVSVILLTIANTISRKVSEQSLY